MKQILLISLLCLFLASCSENSTGSKISSLVGTWRTPQPMYIDDEDLVFEISFEEDGYFYMKYTDYDWDDSTGSWYIKDGLPFDHPDNRYTVKGQFIDFMHDGEPTERITYFTLRDNDH